MFRTLLASAVCAAATVGIAAAPADAAPLIVTHIAEHLTLTGGTATMTGTVLDNRNVPLPAGFTVQLVAHPAGTKTADKVIGGGHTNPYGKFAVRVAARRGWTYAAKVLPGQQMTNHYAGSTGMHVSAR